ncbi:MFS transporter [Bacillus sp. 31A1R]|uniref:MFS transporter n=1 Tax=Robertmurraya mangrovi TaxID=3098077 RepID=A0ABU5J396_9BACI|nr:MFS transporter [Bacillus sp. 31A1R]MDZ5473883.1 MFS transporter [Bacillus sp. 31A1R]
METVLMKNQTLESKLRGFTLTILLTGIFMGALDHGIVGPALSSILNAYQIDASWGVWSFTIYTLLFAVSIPLMGKFSDRFGRKVIFMIGISLFGLGSLLAALAPNFIMFLIGRSIQAIGTGGIFPITSAFIAVSYPQETRAKAMGWIGVIFGLGSILGPIVGGLIIQSYSWQWIFLINVPIAIIVVALISTVKLPQVINKKKIDYLGMLSITAIILSIMLGITTKNLLVFVIGLALIPIFIMIERKSEDPIVKLEYFKSNQLRLNLLFSLVSGFIMASTINLLPWFIETNYNVAKASAALGVTPLAVFSMIASLVGGHLVTKYGAKKVLFLGFTITTIGGVLLTIPASYEILLGIVGLVGFGIGIIIGAPLNILMIQGTSMAEAGSAIGLLSLFRSLGSTIGPTVAGIILVVTDNDFMYVSLLLAALSALSLLLFTVFKRA